MTDWQDISTAPKDETEVLTWDGKYMAVATYAWEDRWQVSGLQTFVPTHWMPLPLPPKATP